MGCALQEKRSCNAIRSKTAKSCTVTKKEENVTQSAFSHLLPDGDTKRDCHTSSCTAVSEKTYEGYLVSVQGIPARVVDLLVGAPGVSLQQQRLLPVAGTESCCWGRGQQDARPAQGAKHTLGAATRPEVRPRRNYRYTDPPPAYRGFPRGRTSLAEILSTLTESSAFKSHAVPATCRARSG